MSKKIEYLRNLLVKLGADSRPSTNFIAEQGVSEDIARQLSAIQEENKQLRKMCLKSSSEILHLETVIRALTLSHAQLAIDLQSVYDTVKSMHSDPRKSISIEHDDDDGSSSGTGGMLN